MQTQNQSDVLVLNVPKRSSDNDQKADIRVESRNMVMSVRARAINRNGSSRTLTPQSTLHSKEVEAG